MQNSYFILELPPPEECFGKIYYFRKPDGKEIYCREREAYVLRNNYQLVAVSDGKTFYTSLQRAVKRQKEELEAIDEEKQMVLEDIADLPDEEKREERRSLLRWYHKEKTAICDEAKKAIVQAYADDRKAAEGHIERIPTKAGTTFFSQDRDDLKDMASSFDQKIAKMIGL